jgi:hypothetical protein
MHLRIVGWPLFALLYHGLPSPAAALQTGPYAALTSATDALLTPAERSGFAEETPYDSMRVYLQRLEASAPEMRLLSYGTSIEGRDLPYAVFARPAVSGPAGGEALVKPTLVLAAGVHGDEPTLRESVLLIARELATEGTSLNRALDRVTVLIVPQLNPDGFAREPTRRRENAAGVDLNRDYTKLEHPEIQSYVRNILIAWDPELFVDGHDGGSFPYNLHYQCPSHAASDARITSLCDDRIFPAVEEKLGEEGYRAWYYQRGTRTRWDVGESDARIGRNYGGLANQVGILFEAPPTQDREDAVRSGFLAYEAVVEWTVENVELLVTTVNEARRETVRMGETPDGDIPIETGYAPEPGRVRYLIGAGQDGAVAEIVSDSLMKRPVATLTRPRPWAYALPPEAGEAIELLVAHGIEVEQLTRAVGARVSAYPMVGISYEAAYDHPAAIRLEVADPVLREVTLPAGSFVVRMGQVRGRVAAHLLEPESRDGVVYWNRMDDLLRVPEIEAVAGAREAGGIASSSAPGAASPAPVFPIYKLMEPVALPVAPTPTAP